MASDNAVPAFMDRFAIRERIDLYIDLLNHRDWNRFGDLWTEDAVWTCSAPMNLRIESRKAMVEMVSTVQQYQFGFVFQMGHGVVVDEVAGNRASARHTLHILSDRFQMIGIYYDRLVKEADGVWRFARRDYRITYHDEQPMPGRIFRMLPDPDYRRLPEP
ncbi:MAG: nuclear transport factor 2 family protein [Gammaproteobacteria bacterium]